tara:strand:+ start:82 stop:963 length:882 start_codon:yes stop_codon:yes gene_type:complete
MKLILGCANFGNRYGLKEKKLSYTKISKIISKAKKLGINHYDTANDYKDSEKFIGKKIINIYKNKKPLIDTKIPKKIKIKNSISNIKSSTEISLKKLNIKTINTLYVHDSTQLLNKNGKIVYRDLVYLKKKKLIKNIGISVYTPQELIKILKKFKIDVVQAPFNILDKRFTSLKISKLLKSNNCKLIARSIFLKGVLLKRRSALHTYFDKWSNIFKKIETESRGQKLSIKQHTLKTINREKKIDNFIIGVSNENQIKEIFNILKNLKNKPLKKLNVPNVVDNKLINPKYWKLS